MYLMEAKRMFNLPALLLLCQVISEASSQYRSDKSEASILGMMLRRHIFKKIPGATFGDVCLRECYRDVRCQSFNYVFTQDMCELSNRTKEARPEDFVSNPERYYFRRDRNRVRLGSIPDLPADSCKEIKASEGGQAVSRKYWLDWIIPEIPVLAYCEMKIEDADECDAFIPVCDVNADCKNTLGSYRCSCKTGYSGDGKTCSDVDECNGTIRVCDVNANCQNTYGSYRCSCKIGFIGNGKSCAVFKLGHVKATSSCASLLMIASNLSGIMRSSQRNGYSNNLNCEWNLTSSDKLQLVFLHVKTHSSADHVKVYDGDSVASRLIATINGSSRPAPILSSSNKLHVRFTSDGSGQSEGFTAIYRAITDGSIRLRGSIPSTGRVEIFGSDQWGTICDRGWDIEDANVVCKQLGFQNASNAFKGATHGQGSGTIWMDNVACSGSESSVVHCNHSGWVKNDCTHTRDASVQCSSVRLANGGINFGRVEVCVDGIWGTVCDDHWDINDANVVCRQLGFSNASSAQHGAVNGQGSDPIWMDDVNCNGGEASLFNCAHRGWRVHDCTHTEDASVSCNY